MAELLLQYELMAPLFPGENGISGTNSDLNGNTHVTQVYSNLYAFAALRADGSVTTWGGNAGTLTGNDSSIVASKLDGSIDVIQVFSTDYAFAALRSDGSVVTWGSSAYGGDSSLVANQLNGNIHVTQIFSTGSALRLYVSTALLSRGVVTLEVTALRLLPN